MRKTSNEKNPKAGARLKFQALLDSFLESRGWGDQCEVNPEEQTVQLITQVNVNEQVTGRLIIRASDDIECIDVAFYFDLICKKSKQEQMALMLNEIRHR